MEIYWRLFGGMNYEASVIAKPKSALYNLNLNVGMELTAEEDAVMCVENLLRAVLNCKDMNHVITATMMDP
jgi:hypothetical protein